MSDEFSQRKSVRKVTAVLDSIKQLTNDEGEKILPVFFSETLSKFYYRNNPELRKEIVEKSKITGVGITDGSTISQITGSAFQEYNFYKNWLNIVEKEFISPIADGWKGFYDYDLLDSVMVGQDSCYVLQAVSYTHLIMPMRSSTGTEHWVKKIIGFNWTATNKTIQAERSPAILFLEFPPGCGNIFVRRQTSVQQCCMADYLKSKSDVYKRQHCDCLLRYQCVCGFSW